MFKFNKSSGQVSRLFLVLGIVILVAVIIVYLVMKMVTPAPKPVVSLPTATGTPSLVFQKQVGDIQFVFQNGGYGASRMSNSHHATLGYGNEHLPPPPPSQEMYIPPPPMAPMLNCIDVAGHIKDCPICSKFYKSDSTVYVIAIVLLAIVCLLLLKKVLDV